MFYDQSHYVALFMHVALCVLIPAWLLGDPLCIVLKGQVRACYFRLVPAIVTIPLSRYASILSGTFATPDSAQQPSAHNSSRSQLIWQLFSTPRQPASDITRRRGSNAFYHAVGITQGGGAGPTAPSPRKQRHQADLGISIHPASNTAA
jgi:hypothetical protein